MTPEHLVAQIRSAVIVRGVDTYKNLFNSTLPIDATDPYWRRALQLYASLGTAQRLVLFEIIRQVSSDTASRMLAILDGVSALEGMRTHFILTSESDAEKLNGDLQDLFLEAEEQEGRDG